MPTIAERIAQFGTVFAKARPPDAVCDVCGKLIAAGAPRYRCGGGFECDAFDMCRLCGQTAPVEAAHTHDGTCCLFRTQRSRHDSIEKIFSGSPTSATILQRALTEWATHPCVAEVVSGVAADGGSTPPRLRWRSYAELGAAVDAVARAMRHAAVDPDATVVALSAPNSIGWLVVDCACVLARLPSACVDDTLAVVDAAASAKDAAEQVRYHNILVITTISCYN